ncbi:hypothetical protein bpr_II372 (plasmid) [Butyrivibrio proteoclasticus B316]|uniref:Uncharacterized protein n=1 Tax=Butyrivibrio proteoclasticus (strain ATCC 51982 / DSM 14932 / B316) TaxID=515622 RepID=E0S4H7_BUTPB|nr:hypothetical protein [Butyrivibrio proteoclasticus]ADL36309.1 hypothetical protein bpr_II372 [Butyrivibrio proteoclasticus B316]
MVSVEKIEYMRHEISCGEITLKAAIEKCDLKEAKELVKRLAIEDNLSYKEYDEAIILLEEKKWPKKAKS